MEGTLVGQGGADAFVGMIGLTSLSRTSCLDHGFVAPALGMSQNAFHRKGILAHTQIW